MINVFMLLIGFSALGWTFISPRRFTDDYLLAPAFGLAASVTLAYVLSANFNMSGADGMAASLTILALCLPVRIYVTRAAYSKPAHLARSMGNIAWYLAPVGLLLIPAELKGVENFFGAVNFDFFYNSQDSWYLSNHTVLQHLDYMDGRILPLDWSSTYQGRFGISLIGAFVYKFLGINPLHFNAILVSSILFIYPLAMAAFARQILGLKPRFVIVAVWISVLSAGFAQGYIYYLLGQISALPIFITTLIIATRLLHSTFDTGEAIGSRWVIAILIFLLNALFIFYAILCFLAFAIILGAMISRPLMQRHMVRRSLRQVMSLVFAFLLVFFVMRITCLRDAQAVLQDWFIAISKVKASGMPIVFTEYLTEGFLPLLFGISTYPVTNSPIFHAFSDNGVLNVTLCGLGIGALVCLLYAFVRFANQSSSGKHNVAVIAVLSGVAFSGAIVCFAIDAPYGVFKIGSWIIPLLLPLFAGIFQEGRNITSPLQRSLVVACASVVILNIISASTYVYGFLPHASNLSFENVKKVNGDKEIMALRDALAVFPDRSLELALPNGIETAWVANEMRAHTVHALTHNYQPLSDKILPEIPCGETKRFPDNALLITREGDNATGDILDNTFQAIPVYKNNSYGVYETKTMMQFVFIGRGAYSVETLPLRITAINGFPEKFRWVEKGVELYVFARHGGAVDVSFDITPGYVKAPKVRTITVVMDGRASNYLANSPRTPVQMRNVYLNAGTNCLVVESKDKVNYLPRYLALFRAGIPLDPRLLSFAISNIRVLPAGVKQ